VGVAAQYDHNLHYARKVSGYPAPHPTRDWPPENVAFLEGYIAWLLAGGASPNVARTLYLPMAGHVLGLALRPPEELDLEADLEAAMDYVRAKGVGTSWLKVCGFAMERFRRYLRTQRGLGEEPVVTIPAARQTEGLPAWLVGALAQFQVVRQRGWRPARLGQNTHRFWSEHLRLWGYLCRERGVADLADLKRQYLYDYADLRLRAGYAVTGINNELRSLQGFLYFLQEQGYSIPRALLRVPVLKTPDSLPRALSDEQVGRLHADFEQRVCGATQSHTLRNALLDRAAFLLLWQAGLRVGEVEELRPDDLQLSAQRLSVRMGKGAKDRTVYLTEVVCRALEAFLSVRGPAECDHVFTYRHRALRKDLVRDRIKAAGKRVGVKVYPHRLRHTCATQLLSAGCRVTSIQRFLGHRRLNSTMIYARVHDSQVAADYFTAMAKVEGRLEMGLPAEVVESNSTTENEIQPLLALVDRLKDANLEEDEKERILAELQDLLLASQVTLEKL
jgi:site-specific recombinase XerD